MVLDEIGNAIPKAREQGYWLALPPGGCLDVALRGWGAWMNVSIQPQLQGVERKDATSLVLSSVCHDLSLGSLGLRPEVVGRGPFWDRPGHQGVN